MASIVRIPYNLHFTLVHLFLTFDFRKQRLLTTVNLEPINNISHLLNFKTQLVKSRLFDIFSCTLLGLYLSSLLLILFHLAPLSLHLFLPLVTEDLGLEVPRYLYQLVSLGPQAPRLSFDGTYPLVQHYYLVFLLYQFDLDLVELVLLVAHLAEQLGIDAGLLMLRL